MYKYVEIYGGKVRDLKTSHLKYAEFCSIFDPSCYWIDVTNVDDVAIGKPRLTWNLFDITAGTHQLPSGYELKKDILGFTCVVREGTQAWYLKK